MESGHSWQMLPIDFCRPLAPGRGVKPLFLLRSAALGTRARLALLAKGLAQMQSSDPLRPLVPHSELGPSNIAFSDERKCTPSRQS